MTLVTCAECGKTWNAELADAYPTLWRQYYCAECWEKYVLAADKRGGGEP